MLGWRGASRVLPRAVSRRLRSWNAARFRMARETIGLDNLVVMVPFLPDRGTRRDKVLAVMAEEGLIRGKDGLEVFVMAEIPANVFLADDFAARFDGFSIGSNDLTQLVLGVRPGQRPAVRPVRGSATPRSRRRSPNCWPAPAPTARRPASAARRPATIRNSPASWSSTASTRSPSARTGFIPVKRIVAEAESEVPALAAVAAEGA